MSSGGKTVTLFLKWIFRQTLLTYALDVMRRNQNSFAMDQCHEFDAPNHYSMRGVTRENFEDSLSEGLPNKCQIMINDTRERPSQYRGTMYYIHLCGDRPQVERDYFNMGTGTFQNNFANRAGQRTTVLGAFFTNYESFDYQPGNSRYQSTRQTIANLSGIEESTAVQLFGLQNTNSTSAPTKKYLHVSPYQSSWGCPSIRAENYWMIRELAENGPSLVLNYGEDMEDPSACE